MKTNFVKLFTICVLVFLMLSCSNNDNPLNQTDFKQKDIVDSQAQQKRLFAIALSKALSDSYQLRELIKREALKMFDNDYDVLYHLIKNEPLSDGNTVRTLLSKYFDNEEKLIQIENSLPTLTIFVPELPEEVFSAKSWDVNKDIPHVAYNTKSTNDVSIVKGYGAEYVLECSLIPDFPVVVVKESERVVQNDRIGVLNKKSNQNILRSNDGINFRFLDDSFNRSLNSSARSVTSGQIDQRLIDAFNIYKNADGWHRDYIYYNISPSTPSGPFSYDFQEHITSFRLRGVAGLDNGFSAYNKISDQTGEQKISFRFINGYRSAVSGWTDGSFEFKVKVLLNAKNGIGTEFVTYFPASMNQLFRVTNTRPFVGARFTINSLRIRSAMDLNLPIFNWDLNQYASSIKIEIEEVDRIETTNLSETRTVQFATNFGIEGVLKKIGLKFGASREETVTQTIQKSYTEGNDELGGIIINFADNVIVNEFYPGSYSIRTYEAGWFEICLEPKRVQ